MAAWCRGVQREYIYANGRMIAGVISDSTAASGFAVYSVHNDHLATPQAITDGHQDVVWQVVEQTPFGEVVGDGDPDGDGSAFVFNVRFPGQYWDEETQTSYNYFRNYDPSLGRYLQSDPIGLQGGINTYAYVGGNPITRVDPYGLWFVIDDVVTGPVDEIIVIGVLGIAAALGSESAMDAINAIQDAISDGAECKEDDACPPCKTVSGRTVPVGTLGYRPLDIIPDNEMQHGVYGSHHNIFVAKQAPKGTPRPCQCFWAKQKYVLKPDQLSGNMVPVEPFVNP